MQDAMATAVRVVRTMTPAEAAEHTLAGPLEVQLQQYYRAALAVAEAASPSSPVPLLSDQIHPTPASVALLAAELSFHKEAVSAASSSKAKTTLALASDALALLQLKVRTDHVLCATTKMADTPPSLASKTYRCRLQTGTHRPQHPTPLYGKARSGVG